MKLSVLLGAALLSQFAGRCVAATPLAQDYSIVYHNADPEYYVEGCGLERLDDGTLVAVVPVVPRVEWSASRRVQHSVVHILRSADGGKLWQPVSELPYYSGVPWIHQGKLYLFGCLPGSKSRNDDLQILCSEDRGATWSAPVTLFKGHYWNCHTGMVKNAERLYWAVDDLSLGNKRGPCLIAGDLSADVMNPASWRISKPVPFPGIPEQLMNAKFAQLPSQYLEPNVFEINGHLRVLAVVKAHRQTTAGLCAVFDAEDKNGELELEVHSVLSDAGWAA